MINIPFYIAYLLTRHECVIVPDFGAFIVSCDESNRRGEENLSVSSSVLGFNSDVKHNDGLLVSFLASREDIPYREASLSIARYVESIRKQLLENRTVQIKWIGKLHLSSDGKIIFIPSFQLSCNAHNFGLNDFYMPLLSEMTGVQDNSIIITASNEKTLVIPLHRRKITKIASVAAALLTLFVVSTPLNENRISSSQQASFITLGKTNDCLPEEKKNENREQEVFAVAMNEKDIENKTFVKLNDRFYYIVISSLPTPEMAQQKAVEYRQKKFPQADVVSSGGKNRVYVDKFENKQDAEEYLDKFRKDYPEHVKAWLLSLRNL